jgi:hypothetical protein
MKRTIFKNIILLSAVLMMVFGGTAIAFAQEDPTTTTTGSGPGVGSTILGGITSPITTSLLLASKVAPKTTANVVGWGMDSVKKFIQGGLGWATYIGMQYASTWLRVTGTLLSMSMFVTLHMSELVNNSPGITLVWRIIRDFSSIFFIFLLLFAAIKMILGLDGGGFKTLVKNIVICGLLINFSLFFTKVIVDGSNVVALSFYNAIVPGVESSGSGMDLRNPISWFKWNINDKGIADVFMNSLKIQSIYAIEGNLGKGNTSTDIIIAGVFGIIIMVTASMVFGIMAFMLIARVAILIMVMVFSPIYFLSMVIPGLKSDGNKLKETLISQATFAPIFMLLLYVVMKVITDPRFNQFVGATDSSQTFANAFLGAGNLGVIFQYVITLTLLTTALSVSKGFSGKAGDFGDKAYKMFSKYALEASGVNYAKRRMLGGTASRLDGYLENTQLGNTRIGRSVREATIGKVAGAKFGDLSYKDDKKRDWEVASKHREILKDNTFNRVMVGNDLEKIGSAMKDLSGGQKSKLPFSKLLNPNVLKNLKKSDFEAIYKRGDSKGESDYLTPEQIDQIKNARLAALYQAANSKDKKEQDAAKNMVDNFDGDDLKKLEGGKFTDATGASIEKKKLLTSKGVVAHMSESQLRKLVDLDTSIRLEIGEAIINHVEDGKPHKAAGYITDKARTTWLGDGAGGYSLGM